MRLCSVHFYKCTSYSFWAVTKQLQAHYHHLLDWSRVDPDLHVARKNLDEWNHVCDLTNTDAYNYYIFEYETLEMTKVNGAFFCYTQLQRR